MDKLPTYREDPEYYILKALEFCDTLKAEDKWYFVDNIYDRTVFPMIRNERCECPISSLVLPEHPELLLETAFRHAKVLDLEEETATLIVVCSDGCFRHSHYSREVRKYLESLVQDSGIRIVKRKSKTIKGEKHQFQV